jgi:hypothetical protein
MLIMQYRKNTHPANSIKEITAMHPSINLKGLIKGLSCLLLEFYRTSYLSFSINRLLQHVAIHNIIETNTDPAENGNIKHW